MCFIFGVVCVERDQNGMAIDGWGGSQTTPRNTEYQFLPFSLSLISKLEIFKSISFNQKFGCQFVIIMMIAVMIAVMVRKAHFVC